MDSKTLKRDHACI